MKTRVCLVACLALSGCSPDGRPPARAYKHWSDRLLVASGGLTGLFRQTPCAKVVKIDGEEISEGTPIDDCYLLSPPREMHGVWLREFEGSKFIPGATNAPRIWSWTINDMRLQDELARGPEIKAIWSRSDRRAYQIRFVGRTMLYPTYNRFGGRDYVTALDRLISIKEIPAPVGSEICLPDCKPSSTY